MAKKNQADIQNVDKRLVDRAIARGDFSHDEHSTALDKLKDLEGEAEDISARVYGAGSSDNGAGE